MLGIALTSNQLSAETLKIPGNASDVKLINSVIKEVVKRSDRFDDYEYIYGEAGEPVSTKKFADLESGALSVLWQGTTSQYEEQFRAVYFPIYRGLLGMRIPIVTGPNENIFANVEQFSKFKSYIPCQGKTWSDTVILEANGLTVAKSLQYPNLFPMLDADRCDYFPRGVFEPFNEVKSYASEYDFLVDKNVMLRYKMPYYIFARKGDDALAEHLEGILADMFDDGTYNKIFFAEQEISSSLPLANLEQRVVFDLSNPDLTQKTKNIPEKYWFDPLKGSN
jgi:hypothetical protein